MSEVSGQWRPGDRALATVRGVADVEVVRTDDPDLPWHSDQRVPDYFGPQTEHAERMVRDAWRFSEQEQVSGTDYGGSEEQANYEERNYPLRDCCDSRVMAYHREGCERAGEPTRTRTERRGPTRDEYHRHDCGDVVQGPAGRCIDPDAGARDVVVVEPARLYALVSDWQANGNSRELGDPTDRVWFDCAQQLLAVLDAVAEE